MISESNLNRYRLFCAVAECESISRAAEMNYISQPAISKAITKMEESLGAQLFIRNHRGVTLTEEGKIMYEQLKSAFDIIKTGEDTIRRINELGIGRLRLGASSILCKHMLLPYLKEFIQLNPHIKITIECQSSSRIMKLLADGRIDIGLIVKPEAQSDVGFYSLGEIEDVFIATQAYVDNLHIRENTSIFEKANIMLLDGANFSRMHVDRYFKENNIVPEHILEVSGMDMLIEFAKTGIGVGCAIKRFVQKELDEGTLIEIPLSVPINKREVGFAYMKNTKPTSAMERFKNFYESYLS
ncbi:MAG: LysR family transcriptional regulator [Oscillospiraceae bacterium]|nr:LysR family transcriptional regulator [Oscillospiraceae bacterium]